MASRRLVAGLAMLLLLGNVASAHEFAGDWELSAMIGGQAGSRNAPAGLKLMHELGRRTSRLAWLNFQVNFGFGSRFCYAPPRVYTDCSGFSGTLIEGIGGVKLKFPSVETDIVPYAKMGGGFVYVIAPGDSDDGIGMVFRPGGGVKYYVMPELAIGGEINLSVGPLFIGCGGGCRDTLVYLAADFSVGIEWNF